MALKMNCVVKQLIAKHELAGWDGKAYAGVRHEDGARLVWWISPWPYPFVGSHTGRLPHTFEDIVLPGTYLFAPWEPAIFPPGQDFEVIAEDKGDFVEIALYRKSGAECADEPHFVEAGGTR